MSNKMIGTIIRFDGYNGIILSNKREIIFTQKDIKPNNELKINDLVSFICESLFYMDDIKLVARFIEKISEY